MAGSGRKSKIAYFYDSAWAGRWRAWGVGCCYSCEPCLPAALVPSVWLSRHPSTAPLASLILPYPFRRSARCLADDYTGYYYGPDHPMKPQRMAMTHQLVLGYGLHQHLDVYVSVRVGGWVGEKVPVMGTAAAGPTWPQRLLSGGGWSTQGAVLGQPLRLCLRAAVPTAGACFAC